MTDFELEVVAIISGVGGIVYLIATAVVLFVVYDDGCSTTPKPLGLRVLAWFMAIPLALMLMLLTLVAVVLVFYIFIGGIIV